MSNKDVYTINMQNIFGFSNYSLRGIEMKKVTPESLHSVRGYFTDIDTVRYAKYTHKEKFVDEVMTKLRGYAAK